MSIKKTRIHAIIHIATVTAGSVGAGFAKIPGADMPLLCALQQAMIIAIGHEYGRDLAKTDAKHLLLTFPSGYGGKALSGLLIGWLPGFGPVIKASTAMVITETVGWTANAYFANSDASH
jgi:uncharacterized protein (DUF697 family)